MKGFAVVLLFAVSAAALPPVYQAQGYGAPTPSYSAPTPSYSAPTPSYSAPTPSYSAPTPSYSAPPAYAPAASGYSQARTEEITSPSQRIDYSVAWSAPVLQRLRAKASGYASSYGSSYGAPAVAAYTAPSGYAAAQSGYQATDYEREGDNIVVGQGNAYIRLSQNVEGGYGTRTTDSYGKETETYADARPDYAFEYGVDAPNGDIKRVQETRQGDNAQGSYSFLQPDGCTRTVNYMVDDWGFKADVKYTGAPHCDTLNTAPAPYSAPPTPSYSAPYAPPAPYDAPAFSSGGGY